MRIAAELDRNDALKARVERPMDLAHAAARDELLEPITPRNLPRWPGHGPIMPAKLPPCDRPRCGARSSAPHAQSGWANGAQSLAASAPARASTTTPASRSHDVTWRWPRSHV